MGFLEDSKPEVSETADKEWKRLAKEHDDYWKLHDKLRQIRNMPPEDQARFCEHGSYVGFNRSLAYRCEKCPEE